MSRVCLDSNVLVAAFAARGLCSDLLGIVLTDHDLVIPEVVVTEVRRVLRAKLKLSAEAMDAVEAVFERCDIVPTTGALASVAVRDPDDERVLAEAVAARAEMLVSGDADLLDIAEQSPIPILSPRAFFTLLRGAL